ncbi:hypothetical protein ACHAXT_012241 [Thalassiosira profunda]
MMSNISDCARLDGGEGSPKAVSSTAPTGVLTTAAVAPSEAAAMTAGIGGEQSLQPVAASLEDNQPLATEVAISTILQDHLLSNISAENDRLREENEAMYAARMLLSMVKIITLNPPEPRMVAVIDLGECVVVPDEGSENGDQGGWRSMDGGARVAAVPFHEIPSDQLPGKQLMTSLRDAASLPLADLSSIVVSRADQQVGSFQVIPNNFLSVSSKKGAVRGMVALSDDMAIQGKITGLSDDVVAQFKDGELDAEAIMEYLQTGTGLQEENAMFTPRAFHMCITPDTKKVLDLLRVCRGHLQPCDEVMVNQTEYELSRRAIVDTIGCNDAQWDILDKNVALKCERVGLRALRDILGTIEFHHSSGTLSVDLREGHAGKVSSGNLFWCIDCSEKEKFSLKARDIFHYSATVSGTVMELVVQGIRPPDDGDGSTLDIRFVYHNGCQVYGNFDSSVEESELPASDTPVKLTSIVFDFMCVKDTLASIGIFDD